MKGLFEMIKTKFPNTEIKYLVGNGSLAPNGEPLKTGILIVCPEGPKRNIIVLNINIMKGDDVRNTQDEKYVLFYTNLIGKPIVEIEKEINPKVDVKGFMAELKGIPEKIDYYFNHIAVIGIQFQRIAYSDNYSYNGLEWKFNERTLKNKISILRRILWSHSETYEDAEIAENYIDQWLTEIVDYIPKGFIKTKRRKKHIYEYVSL